MTETRRLGLTKDVLRAAAAPMGVSIREYVAANPDVKSRAIEQVLFLARQKGLVVNMVRMQSTRYFLGEAQMEAARPAVIAMWAEQDEQTRRAANARSIERVREKRGREQAKPKKPTPPRPLAAKEVSEVRRIGPALLDVPADTSAAKVTRVAAPPGRYAVPEDFRGAFSMAGIGRDVKTGEAW